MRHYKLNVQQWASLSLRFRRGWDVERLRGLFPSKRLSSRKIHRLMQNYGIKRARR